MDGWSRTRAKCPRGTGRHCVQYMCVSVRVPYVCSASHLCHTKVKRDRKGGGSASSPRNGSCHQGGLRDNYDTIGVKEASRD